MEPFPPSEGLAVRSPDYIATANPMGIYRSFAKLAYNHAFPGAVDKAGFWSLILGSLVPLIKWLAPNLFNPMMETATWAVPMAILAFVSFVRLLQLPVRNFVELAYYRERAKENEGAATERDLLTKTVDDLSAQLAALLTPGFEVVPFDAKNQLAHDTRTITKNNKTVRQTIYRLGLKNTSREPDFGTVTLEQCEPIPECAALNRRLPEMQSGSDVFHLADSEGPTAWIDVAIEYWDPESDSREWRLSFANQAIFTPAIIPRSVHVLTLLVSVRTVSGRVKACLWPHPQTRDLCFSVGENCADDATFARQRQQEIGEAILRLARKSEDAS